MLNKKFRIILLFVILILSLFIFYKIATTYAVFYSEVSGTASKDLAKWNITVNNKNIVTGIAENFIINSFSTTSNANVKPGKIAPGVDGNFLISINSKDTDVSVRYDITIDVSDITNNKITLDSVTEITAGNTLIQTNENTYTGIIALSTMDEDYINDIKLNFIWENAEINNANDTIMGTTESLVIQIPVTVNVKQYLGETIIPYI